MKIVPVHELDAAGFAAALEIQQRDELALDPDIAPTTPAEFRLWATQDHTSHSVHDRVVAIDGSTVRGMGHLTRTKSVENLALCEVELFDIQDRPAAFAIASALLDKAAADGRTNVLGWGPEKTDRDFWISTGAELSYVERLSDVHFTDIDPGLMNSWIAGRDERAPDIELVRWVGPCPTEHIANFIVSNTQ